MPISDPDVRRAFDRLKVKQEDDLRIYRDQMRFALSPLPGDEPPYLNDDEIMVLAQAEVAAMRVWQRSPEGRYVDAIMAIHALAIGLKIKVDQSLSARLRSWRGEIRQCDVLASELERLASQIRTLAIDAQLAVSDELEKADG